MKVSPKHTNIEDCQREITYSEISGDLLDTVLVDHLVTSEESEGIWVALERLDDSKNALEVAFVVGADWVLTVQALATSRAIDIQDHVDTSGIEDRRAIIVVGVRVEVVNTDGVHLRESQFHQAVGLAVMEDIHQASA